jgi:site-specific DNA-methyltransferase (adenine-specific)
VLDFFAGSGTTGAVAASMGRRFVLVDSNDQACRTMAQRLGTDGVAYLDDASIRRSS